MTTTDNLRQAQTAALTSHGAAMGAGTLLAREIGHPPDLVVVDHDLPGHYRLVYCNVSSGQAWGPNVIHFDPLLYRETVATRTLRTAPTAAPGVPRSKAQLIALVRTLFEAVPVENGYSHAVEPVLRTLAVGGSSGREWIASAILNDLGESAAADLLRCVGRLEYADVDDWGLGLAERALLSESVDLRDAALQALEAWGQPSIRILRSHLEREPVRWLAEYVRNVLSDLEQ